VLEEDDCVGACQVEAEAAHGRRQEQHVDGGVRVEPLDNRKPGRVRTKSGIVNRDPLDYAQPGDVTPE